MTQLVDDMRDEADLCRNEGATDIAALLDQAATEIGNLTTENAALAARVEALEGALKPFAFLDMGKDEDEGVAFTTQEVWETIYRDRVQDWISFEELEAARAALAGDPS